MPTGAGMLGRIIRWETHSRAAGSGTTRRSTAWSVAASPGTKVFVTGSSVSEGAVSEGATIAYAARADQHTFHSAIGS